MVRISIEGEYARQQKAKQENGDFQAEKTKQIKSESRNFLARAVKGLVKMLTPDYSGYGNTSGKSFESSRYPKSGDTTP